MQFIGSGNLTHNAQGEPIAEWTNEDGLPVDASEHPSGYISQPSLVAAVNTALLLRKPLLLSGNPGTGKSRLSDRLAWELNLGQVLRFDAQSLSESQDLFYRFDLVGRLADVELAKARPAVDDAGDSARREGFGIERYLSFGPLGKAILRAQARPDPVLLSRAWPQANTQAPIPSRSVVLIDEIDKATRDFPNDLLNAIERLEFRIRELEDHRQRVAADDSSMRPIVVVTSNSERDLPAPFLRRCVFFHIDDPDQQTLRQIVHNRVFRDRDDQPSASDGSATLPPLYEQLLAFFLKVREQHGDQLHYQPGPSELIDWTRAVRLRGPSDQDADMAGNLDALLASVSALAKHKEDLASFRDWLSPQSAGTAM